MDFNPFEVTIPHITYACLGGFVVVFGMFSLFLREKLYIGEACWAFLFGVIIGPYGANVFDPRRWANEDDTNVITLEFTRVVLAIGVFAIGVELPKAYMIRHWKSLFFLLVPVMTWGWFVSAGLIYGLIPGLNFLSSLVVAACLTPTDPILAAAVVGGKWADKHVPAHIRHLLAAESGCNDGAAYPFLFISLYIMFDSPNVGEAVRDWFVRLWLCTSLHLSFIFPLLNPKPKKDQVILGIVLGAIIGFAFRHLMKFCQRHNLIDRHSYVAQYISLAMLTIGVTALIGSDDLLAAFSCGTAFAWDGFFNRQTEESVFSSVIDLLFNIAAFVYVGAWMPFSAFQNQATTLTVWRLFVIAILVFILRRLPPIIALYRWIPDIKTLREAIFSGHFGPIGIGAVFISTLAEQFIRTDGRLQSAQSELLAETIQPIVAFMVLCSIVLHGLSIPSFSLGRRVHSVSRTWSRHTGQAEWANQITVVERGGQDIVINRDSVDVEVINEEQPGKQSLINQVKQSLGLLHTLKETTSQLEDDAGQAVKHKVDEIEMKVQGLLDAHTAHDTNPAGPSGSDTHHHDEEDAWASASDHSGDDKGPPASISSVQRIKSRPLRLQHSGSSRRSGRQRTSIRRPNAPPPIALKTSSTSPVPPSQTMGSEPPTSSPTPVSGSRTPPVSSSSSSSIFPGTSGSQTPTPTSPPTLPEDSEQPRGRSYSANHAHFATQPSPHSMTPNSRPHTAGETWTSSGKRHRHRRPGTAESSILRPGTGESLQNARLSHIRMLHSSPPTRDSSPSRSVRFLDGNGEEQEIRSKASLDRLGGGGGGGGRNMPQAGSGRFQ
ncbi:hypothetical protein H0H93_012185 [Arthromyces matolae]|nr:hypothetical protein H0H93_012185 [Arthromyces matolae]